VTASAPPSDTRLRRMLPTCQKMSCISTVRPVKFQWNQISAPNRTFYQCHRDGSHCPKRSGDLSDCSQHQFGWVQDCWLSLIHPVLLVSRTRGYPQALQTGHDALKLDNGVLRCDLELLKSQS
jgi:hypothetical protein